MAKINLPILFDQGDSRWGDILLGFNTVKPYDLRNYGCLLSCWAMCDRYYGKDTDPARLNEMFKGMGIGKAFDKGGNYVPGGNNLAYGDIKETRTITPSVLTDAQIGQIKTSIDNGYPVIIGIDYNPKDVDYDSHFVVIVDYNPSEENDFTIADPLGGRLHSLKDYLGWFKPNARNTIESFVVTSGPKPKLTNEMIAISKDHYDLYLKNHDQWHKLVHYLKPEADPNVTLFEDIQTIVAGIKSRQTDLENQLKQAIADRALAETEVQNQKDKLANVVDECQRELKLQKAEFDALKATIPDMSKLEGQYKATIDTIEGQLREAQKATGLKDLEITKLTADLKLCQSGLKKYNALEKLIMQIADWIKKVNNK